MQHFFVVSVVDVYLASVCNCGLSPTQELIVVNVNFFICIHVDELFFQPIHK